MPPAVGHFWQSQLHSLALSSKAKESEDLIRMKLALPKKLKSEQLSKMHQVGMA
jgi:hypothetical protein